MDYLSTLATAAKSGKTGDIRALLDEATPAAVRFVTKKAWHRGLSERESRSLAEVEIWRASRLYDPDRGAFANYLYFYLRQALRAEARQGHGAKLICADEALAHYPAAAHVVETVAAEGLARRLNAAVRVVGGARARALSEAFDGATCHAVAAQLGVTDKRVHQLIVAVREIVASDDPANCRPVLTRGAIAANQSHHGELCDHNAIVLSGCVDLGWTPPTNAASLPSTAGRRARCAAQGAEVLALHAAGRTTTEIAQHQGRQRRDVARWLLKYARPAVD